MPLFIDSHPMKGITPDALNRMQDEPPDEFGVTHHEILYSEEGDRIFCVLDAPDSEAVHRHHEKAGVECEWVHEVKSTRP